MADELDQQYMRTRQAMRKWQGQIFEDEKPEEMVETGDPIVVPQEGGPTQVYMGAVRRMKPKEGTGWDPNAPKAEAPPTPPTTITPAPVKPGPHEQTIVEAATRHGIDPNLLRAVVQEESGGRPGAVSKKGAQGVMQLMPETAAELGVTDPLDPVQSIEGGAKYLSQLMKRYDGDQVKALAAYNFGPRNVAQGKPYPAATKSYIEKIMSHLPTDVSAEAGEAAPALAPDEAVGITPRREFTVESDEVQKVRQDWQQKLKELSTGETAVKELGKVGKQVAEAVRPGFEVAARAIGMDEEAAATVGTAFVEFMGGLPGDESTDFAAGVETALAALPAIAGIYKVGKTVGGAAVEGILKNKEAIIQEFQKAASVIKGERGSVPLGGKSPLSEAEWKALDEQFKGATPPSSPVWYHGSDAAGAQAIEQAGHVTAMASGDVFLTPARWAAEQYAQAKGGKVFAINRDDIPADLLQQSTRPAGFVETSIPKGMTDVRIPVQGGGGGKPPSILPPGAAAPADEPLSSKELALISKREESRQNYGFKVEGFEEELTKQRRGPVLSDEAVQKLAAESGFTLEDLMYLKPGSVLAPEIQLAAREVYRAAADRMTTSAKTYLAMPTPENMNDFAQAFTQAGLATTRIIGTFAESGRTMRLLNQKVPGMAKAGEAQAHDPQFRIQDAYIKQMYEFFRQAEAKSKMGGFAGPAGQAAQPGVVTPGQLAQMVVELPSEEAVMNFAKAAIKPTWSDMLYEVWINGLLSGPVTHSTNIISNAATIAWNIPERAVASMMHPQTVRPGEAAAMMGGVMESVGDAWRLAWKAFKEDKPQFGQGKLEMPTRAITADAFDFTGNVGRAIDYLGITARLPGRFLMAADDFFKAIAFRAELRALAKRESFKQVNELGLTGKEASKTIKEIEHRILADPPEHIKEAAQDFAAYTTFTRELGETGSAWQQAIHKTPMMRVAVPFIRTPANIFKFAGERTPFALASKAVVAELKAGGERAALAQAKIALGSMTMGLVAMYTASGMITGGGPKDKALRKQWEDDGWQPYSIKIGNEYYSYARIEPFGSLIGMAADATEIMGQLDEKQAEELAAALAMAVSRNFSNKTFVKGLSGTLNAAMGNDVNVWKGFLEKELPTILPYSSALGQTAKVVDPVQREVRSILGAVKAKVPGWSETLQAELNIWGEVEPVRTALGPDFISPIYSSVYKDDPVINEMNRLEKAFTVPSRAVGGLKPGSDDLPDATYWRYVELSAGKDNLIKGMNLHDKIHKTITAPMYGMATKEGQIAYIQSDIDLFRQAAMLRLRKENPEFDKAMLRQEFKEKTKKSAATQERVLAAPRLQ